jgi:riboflavin transporter FmnP
MTNSNTKKIVTLSMLCALAYTVMFVFKASPPLVAMPPLKFDPKDIILILGGFLYGPLSALAMSVIVSFLEMLSVSGTGWWGCLANILSSAAFVCTASLIYHKRKTLAGAIIGLTVGVITVTAVMTLWNYLVVPIYMGWPRAAVVPLLVPVFIPFNLFKSGLNAVLTIMLFKPLVTALYRAELIEPAIIGTRSTKAKWIFVALGTIMVVVVFSLNFASHFFSAFSDKCKDDCKDDCCIVEEQEQEQDESDESTQDTENQST